MNMYARNLFITLIIVHSGVSMAESPQPTSISGTHYYELHSKAIGETFTINVALPPGAGDEPLPVVYLTDGNMMFPMVTSTIRLLQLGQELPPMLLVGIGYKNTADVMLLRSRDLTPTHDDTFDGGGLSEVPEDFKTGGADAFLDFIRDEVKPFIKARYKVQPDADTLAGDSLGGLFALHALFTRPSEYRNYIAGSPSIWWDKAVLMTTEAAYAENNEDLAARLFISIGSLEEQGERAAPFKMVTNMHALADRLESREYPSFAMTRYEFEKETHLSVIPATFSRGLRVVFTNPQP